LPNIADLRYIWQEDSFWLIEALEELRAEFPKLPFPWLFRRESYHLSPANFDTAFIRKLEERDFLTVETAAEISARRIPA